MYFSIEMMLGAIAAYKELYKISTLELVELKLQLKEILDYGYIQLSVSPWGAPVLFLNKKNGNIRLCIYYR